MDYLLNIAAFLAFFGVLLTIRNSGIQHQASLDHAAAQANRQREMTLRRDVYLPAVEAVSALQFTLGRLLNVETKDVDVQEQVAKHLPALMKVQLVGNDASVQAALRYQTAFLNGYTALNAKRLPLLQMKLRYESLEAAVAAGLAEQKRWLNALQDLNLQGNKDREKFEYVQQSSDIQNQAVDKLLDEQGQINRDRTPGFKALLEESAPILGEVGRLVPETILAFRNELELPLDRAAYVELFEEQNKQGKQAVERFLESFDKLRR